MTTTPVPGFLRITHNSMVMGDTACIRSMRVMVAMILGKLGAGVTINKLLASCPCIKRQDVIGALRFGASHKAKEH